MGVNMLAQSVSARGIGQREQLSLSGNPDLTLDLLDHFETQAAKGRRRRRHRQHQLAVCRSCWASCRALDRPRFNLLLDHERYGRDPILYPERRPSAMWSMPLGSTPQSLVRDGGTLQLGIGELGEAIVYALQRRHQRNDVLPARDWGLTGVADRFRVRDRRYWRIRHARSRIVRRIRRCLLTASWSFTGRAFCRAACIRTLILQRLLDDEHVITEKPTVETLVALARAGIP
jgi:hypothetical protein